MATGVASVGNARNLMPVMSRKPGRKASGRTGLGVITTAVFLLASEVASSHSSSESMARRSSGSRTLSVDQKLGVSGLLMTTSKNDCPIQPCLVAFDVGAFGIMSGDLQAWGAYFALCCWIFDLGMLTVAGGSAAVSVCFVLMKR